MWALRAAYPAGLALGALGLHGCGAPPVVRELRESEIPPTKAAEPDPLGLNLAGAENAAACPVIALPDDFPAITSLSDVHPVGNGSLLVFDRASSAARIYRNTSSRESLIQVSAIPFAAHDKKFVVLAETNSTEPEAQLLNLVSSGAPGTNALKSQLNWLTVRDTAITLRASLELEDSLADADVQGMQVGPNDAIIGLARPGELILMHLTLADNPAALMMRSLGVIRTTRSARLVSGYLSNKGALAIVREQLSEGVARLWGVGPGTLFGDSPQLLLEGSVRDTLLIKGRRAASNPDAPANATQPANPSTELSLVVTLQQDPQRSLMPVFAQTAVGGVWELSLGLGAQETLPRAVSASSATASPGPDLLLTSLEWIRRSRPIYAQLFAHTAASSQAESSENKRPVVLGWLQQPTEAASEGGRSAVGRETTSRPNLSFVQRLITIGEQPGQESEPWQPCRGPYLDGIKHWAPSMGYIGLGESEQGSQLVVLGPNF